MVDQETLLNWFDYQLTTYFIWASVALLIWEYLLTFGHEVTYIWPSPWNTTKVLYLLSRYTPFVDAGLLLAAQFLSLGNHSLCADLYHINGWVFLIGTAFTEILLSLRTWAVWGNDKRITIGLPIFFLALWAPMFYLNVLFVHMFDDFVILDACFVAYHAGAPPVLWEIFILLMAYDTGLAILMGIRAFKHYRSTKLDGRRIAMQMNGMRAPATVADAVFRDGFMFYLFLFAFSAIQVGVSRTGRAIVMNLLPNMHRVLHSALASRVIINIRESGAKEFVSTDGSISMQVLPPTPTSPLSPRLPQSPGWVPLNTTSSPPDSAGPSTPHGAGFPASPTFPTFATHAVTRHPYNAPASPGWEHGFGLSDEGYPPASPTSPSYPLQSPYFNKGH